MKLYEFIDECLYHIGVEKVFGIPGSLIMPVWQNLKHHDIVLCNHEQEASYVAVGYTKMSRKPVCVLTTGGPGVTNCISGIAAANIDSVPLIYISGRTPICKNGFGQRQEESRINRMFDSVDVLKSVTKASVCIDNVETAPQIIWNTIRSAIEDRNGVVHLSIPIDIQTAEVYTEAVNFSIKKLIDIELSLKISKRPLFILGWGCWMADSYNEVYALSEKVNAPVLVSSKAYCCIKKEHKMFLGELGYGYNAVLDEFIKSYHPDSIISFGSSLGDKDISHSVIYSLTQSIPTYIISNDVSSFSHKSQSYSTIETFDMKRSLYKFLKSVPSRNDEDNLTFDIRLAKKCAFDFWKQKIEPSDFMARCIEIINQKIDDRCTITADAGNHLANAGALIVPSEPQQMFLDVGLRAMGTGICTAVGMAIANRRRKYIAITGDGCMLMNGNVMHLAYKLNLPVLFIVFNNHSLGRVRVGQSLTENYLETDIHNVDFLAYARSFGLKSYRFDSPETFYSEFSKIPCSDLPALIEIITDKDEIPVSVKGNIS